MIFSGLGLLFLSKKNYSYTGLGSIFGSSSYFSLFLLSPSSSSDIYSSPLSFFDYDSSPLLDDFGFDSSSKIG